MKKAGRIISWGLVAVFTFVLGGDWTLRVLTNRPWFRDYVLEKVQKTMHREVRAEKINASLTGIHLKGVSMAEEGGFEKGEFLTVPRAQIYFSLLHLLHAHIKISQLTLQDARLTIVRFKDGKFNFETIGDSSKQETTEDAAEEEGDSSSLFRFTLNNVVFDKLAFAYKDQATGQTFSAEDIYVTVRNFSLDKLFDFTLNTKLGYQDKEQTVLIPMGIQARANLGNLDFSKARLEVVDWSAKHNKVLVRLKGEVINWEDPTFWARLSSHKISSEVANPWLELPLFEIPELTIYVAGKFAPSVKTVTLSSGTIHLTGGDLFVEGRYQYAKNTYDANGTYTLNLTDLSTWFPQEYKEMGLKGVLQGNLSADAKQAELKLDWNNGGYFNRATGRFSDVVASVKAQETMDFKKGSLEGKIDGNLNQHPFQTTVTMAQTPQRMDINLKAFAKRLVLPSAESSKQEEPEFVEEVTLEPISENSWAFPPIHLKSDIQVGSLDAPYLYGTDIQFTSDLQAITPKLDKAHGELKFVMGKGKILDLYKLTNANAITKVLFLSLNVIGKVFNSLNVFSVLNGLGKGMISAVTGGEKDEQEQRMIVQTVAGPDGELMEVMVPYSEHKTKGQLSYEKFETKVNFEEGVATIKEGTFVSDTMSFRLDGTTDFNSGAIKMKVHAAPGKHEVDGMLPLAVNIAGTVQEPKGSMSMVGSVASLVKQTVANNVVSRQVKKGVKGILGIFKKKGEAQEVEEEVLLEMPTEDKAENEDVSLSEEEQNVEAVSASAEESAGDTVESVS